MTHAVCIIGLGIMGQRMLANMRAHERFTLATAWDPDRAACVRTAERYPELRIAGSAAEAIADARVGVVYIACPPAWHREHALASFAAGKAVYCEKPLGVDVSASVDLVDAAARSGCCNIVNFSLASAAATREVGAMLGAGALGALAGVDVYVHFSRWPREWQAGAAAWLSRRELGGFTRELLLDDPRQTGYVLQLDNAAAALSGRAHSMPGFADALRVPRIVEDILRA